MENKNKKRNILLIVLVLMMAAGVAKGEASVTGDTGEYLEWIMRYLPLPDKSGYGEDFFRRNVELSLQARREMPWGSIVPEREFRHFVLPVRVNNENLDMSREVFYKELKDRVKGLSMKDAVLEVNHWCHEKVTYQPSDARTSSPLSSVSQAIGRCGEESTFAVAALRAVGIPARQVYTPRWAHTDDNHAWVEAWADGEWYFLGACEPAPMLNVAWFNAPASRGMLMTTNVFGEYDGPEEKLRELPLLTTINVTSNYAPVGEAKVVVRYPDGKQAEGVDVNFCIYNYSEFYPAVTKKTDKAGRASLVCGKGDVLAWATDGEKFGFAKVNPSDSHPAVITLDKDGAYSGGFDIDVVPPMQSGRLPEVSEEAQRLNDMRFAREDSIRKAYTSTFFSEEEAKREAQSMGLDVEESRMLAKILTESRGNGKTLLSLLKILSAPARNKALRLLCAVSEKDRRDIPVEVVVDNLYNTDDMESPLYVDYILNPRVENEWLVPYKEFFRKQIKKREAEKYRQNPSLLVEWVGKNIALDTALNPSGLRMDPRAVWRERNGDARSRNIMFVSAARSLGIPARIDPVTAKTQYATPERNWMDVKFGGETAPVKARTGRVHIPYTPSGSLVNPKYYSQFSISKIDGGRTRQLEYAEGAGLQEMAQDGLELEEGQYFLLSGRRMADGSVLTHGEIFQVKENETVEVPLTIRDNPAALSVIGSLNAENIYHDIAEDADKSLLSTTGRGYYVVAFVKPGDEPSAHILNDLLAAKERIEASGRKVMVLFADEDEWRRFDRNAYKNLPDNVVFGVDNRGASLSEAVASLNLGDASRPVVLVADTFNRVVFVSRGYTIGIGDRLAEILHDLK